MPIFVSTTFINNGSSVIEAVDLLASKNIFNIELGSIHCFEKDIEDKLMDIKDDFNFLMHNFFPPSKERFILNIASTDNSVRNRSLSFIKKSIDFALKIDTRIYTIHPGFLVDPIGESKKSINYDFDFGDTGSLNFLQYNEYFKRFIESVNIIDDYIAEKNIKVAIETQGSFNKKDFMFFDKANDYCSFCRKNNSEKIGINLNLGHLNLASQAWGFDKNRVIEILGSKLIAVEISHNEGKEDEHRSLKANTWYTAILKNEVFSQIPVIFEGRGLKIDKVLESYDLLVDILS